MESGGEKERIEDQEEEKNSFISFPAAHVPDGCTHRRQKLETKTGERNVRTKQFVPGSPSLLLLYEFTSDTSISTTWALSCVCLASGARTWSVS